MKLKILIKRNLLKNRQGRRDNLTQKDICFKGF